MVGLVLAGGAILGFGSDPQKSDHLPPTVSGERVWCQLFSEPGAGSDLASLQTRAVRDGDRYLVTGQKVWCSNGRVSDWGILLARTDPEAPKHKGISFLLLDMSLPGVEVRPLRQMTGEAEFDEVFLDEVPVPADCRLGPENEGWTVGMATLANERGHIGASAIALARRLDSMASIGSDGSRGGPLDPIPRDRLAELLARGQALLALGRRQGPDASIAGSLMKLGVTDLLYDAADLAVGVDGAAGMLTGESSARLLGSPAGRIAGGTSQIQRNLVGERILGLPKEPRHP